jgi:Lyase
MLMDPSALNALSPMDGRYAAIAAPLRNYFSEAALIRERIRVEALWFEQLTAPTLRLLAGTPPPAVLERNATLARDPGPDAAEAVKIIDQRINHDVKAVEYFVRDQLAAAGAADSALELVHFGCTSEDINNLCYARLLKQARVDVLLPQLDALLATLRTLAGTHAELPMLARTHGQSASPTTFGKEMANVGARLERATPTRGGGDPRQMERRGRQLQRSPQRAPRYRLDRVEPRVHRLAAAELECLHHADRAARLDRRVLRRLRGSECHPDRPVPRPLGLYLPRLPAPAQRRR